MSKKNRSSQFPKGSKPQSPAQPVTAVPPKPAQPVSKSNQSSQETSSSAELQLVRPEQMSLDAYQHIQLCLNGKPQLDKEDVTAILRLSQHLRVFGLLSAVGYLKHSKAGKVQDRTKPMWKPLLWRLIYEDKSIGSELDLMTAVEQMARDRPPLYMATWRRALILSNHWNFWARAYQKEDKTNGQDNALHGSDVD
ncbi:MAG: hypothetical protein SNJ68_12040 [Cyanobacteriota bacterium]